jgi:hypothetical protein
MRAPWIVALLGAGVLVGGSARADVAPPPDYVESCTVARQQAPGEQCQACDAWHGDREICARTLASSAGWAKRCQTRGASTWTEIWCRSASAPPPPPPTDRPNPPDGPTIGPASPDATHDNRFAEPPAPARAADGNRTEPTRPIPNLPPSSTASRGCGGACALGRIDQADLGWAGASAALTLLALGVRRRRRAP